MRKELKDLGLPPSILSMLEGFPATIPAFPSKTDSLYLDSPDEEDVRIIPGGPSSSSLLRHREDIIQGDIESLLQELRRFTYAVNSLKVMAAGVTPLTSLIASKITAINSVTGNAAVIDFYNPSSALLTSNCSHEPLYGQITLPYANSPQSMLTRPSKKPKPGVVVKFTTAPSAGWSNTYVNSTTQWNQSDADTSAIVDGRLDSAWSTPVDGSSDLLVSISLPPTMAATTNINSLGIVPWPLGATTVVDVQVRTGEVISGLTPGWRKLSLVGQTNYTTNNSGTIEGALASRFFIPPAPIKEIVVRLRPLNPTTLQNIGLSLVDCWSIDFKPVGNIVLDSSEVGIENISEVILAGHDPSTILPNTNVSLIGSQITLDLSSSGPGYTPVFTAVAVKQPANGSIAEGFDVSVFAP